ncbi:non-homologous end-joining DNA ligase [Lottiidibacillus patelloidae]|nr:non-homologous end-joining DNA ligase [Lottiidibacillus patelloidae]
MGASKNERIKLTINDQEVAITNPMKKLWPSITKSEYINYLITVSPLLLPYLRKRLLTVIRYPNGVQNEAFFQKNSPEYTPDFVETKMDDGKNYILCSNLETLIWLGNQGAIEYHIPFQQFDENGPREIVFDLDPPSRDHFLLAIEAALIIKEILEKLNIVSYIKTSGNKGMQILIPLLSNSFTYEETKVFTAFIASYLVNKEPKWFTIERLKKNRKERLYVDFIQHAEGKTIIAPYSVRGNEDALVSTPLQWSEVTRQLNPSTFTMGEVINRIKGENHLKLNLKEMEIKNKGLHQLIKNINNLT